MNIAQTEREREREYKEREREREYKERERERVQRS